MLPHALYLHGFGSGPLTAKGLALGRNLAQAVDSYTIPDLEGGDFFNLTTDAICERAVAAIAALPDNGQPVLLAGSSLGGYTAALLASQGRIPRVGGLLLLAPAFGFTARWSQLLGEAGEQAWRREGRRLFHHHARNQDEWLSSAFLDSCRDLPAIPAPSRIPTVIIHGYRDETVAWRMSQTYVDQARTANTPLEWHLVDSDHSLTTPRDEALIAWCACDLMTRWASTKT